MDDSRLFLWNFHSVWLDWIQREVFVCDDLFVIYA